MAQLERSDRGDVVATSGWASPIALEAVAMVKKLGFESAIHFTRVGARAFEIAAIGASGQLLGRSGTVTAD